MHKSVIAILGVLCLAVIGFQVESGPDYLVLENSAKLLDLVGRSPSGDNVLEGSGVIYRKDRNQSYVVCDNLYNEVIDIGNQDKYINLNNVHALESYEGITFNNITKTFFLVTEQINVPGTNRYKSVIVSFNESFSLLTKSEVAYVFEDENKGIEGVSTVIRNNTLFLLGLCEGNNCQGGNDGKDPGDGTILVMVYDPNSGINGNWQVVDTIALPSDLPYADYSGIDVYDNRFIVVVSQSESSMWIGQLDDETWTIKGGSSAGFLYYFPVDSDGDKLFCEVEGVSWMTDHSVVVTTDKTDDDDTSSCDDHSESISIFTIPNFSFSLFDW